MPADERPLRLLFVELNEQLMDVAVDVVTNLAHPFERDLLWVVEHPADSTQAGSDRAYLLAAGRDCDVGPLERVLVELSWHVHAWLRRRWSSSSRRDAVTEKAGLKFVRTFHQPWPDKIEGVKEGDVVVRAAQIRVGAAVRRG